jgi:uncharacterized protein YoxC
MAQMNEAERNRFLDALRSDDRFRAAVRRELLTDELLNLPEVVAGLATDVQQLTATTNTLVDTVAQQRRDFTSLATEVRNYMERTITLVGEGFQTVLGGIAELGTGVAELGTGVAELGTGITGLRSDMDTQIAELRADTAAGFAAVDAKFDQVNAEIRAIKDQLAS